MPPDDKGSILQANANAISGLLPVALPLRVLAGPATEDQFNTIRPTVIPIACWRVEDGNFEFDSSFIHPVMTISMETLKVLLDLHPGAIVSIFGHADPVGNDDYNKALAGRRAQAVFGMLLRRDDLWEDLFQHGDWGNKSIQVMLAQVGFPPGRTDGVMDGPTKQATQKFQQDNGLPADGVAGKNTRKALYLKYMDQVCSDANSKPFKLTKDQFLARGDDAQGKGDFQGCGEFNPVLMFSKAEQQQFEADKDKTQRNIDNRPNRRVLALLFRPGSRVDPTKWPCPRAKEGPGACRKRFWSDADKRRQFQEDRREFGDTHDTFACRFYQRLTDRSPCERVLITFTFRLYDMQRRFIANAPFELSVGGRPPTKSLADAQGFAIVPDVEVPNEVVIKWGFPPDAGKPPVMLFEGEMFLSPEDADRETEATQKLQNLGYPQESPLDENTAAFQRDYGQLASPPLRETGKLDDATMKLLRDVFVSSEDNLQQDKPQRNAQA